MCIVLCNILHIYAASHNIHNVLMKLKYNITESDNNLELGLCLQCVFQWMNNLKIV